MIRGIVTSVIEGVIKRFTAAGRAGETIANREYLQHYGFTSRPLAGAELVIIVEGNNIIAVASDDRRYRLTIADGEAALYDDQGQKVHLKRNGIVEVVAIEQLIASTKVATITATTSGTVTTPTLTAVASTKVRLETPLVECTGLLAVTGDITCANLTAVSEVKDAGGAKSMSGMRGKYNTHQHWTGTAWVAKPPAADQM